MYILYWYQNILSTYTCSGPYVWLWHLWATNILSFSTIFFAFIINLKKNPENFSFLQFLYHKYTYKKKYR